MNEPEHENTDGPSAEHAPLEEVAADGPLPGAEAAEDAAERGEDHSDTADPDQKAEEIGGGDVVGGINMH